MDSEEPPLPPNPELLDRQPKWFKPVFISLILASAIFAITSLAIHLGIPRHVDSVRHAAGNARIIGFAVLKFESDFGTFPNSSTRSLVEKKHGTSINLAGTSSNALFRQLFASQIVDSEYTFHVKTRGAKKPDNIITPGNVLEPKSCGFSYITGLSNKDDPLTPIVLTPLIPGTTRFDPKPFRGSAIVVFIDNSVRTYKIHKDGHVYDKGINLLSPKHPIWKGKAPVIRYPE